MQNNTLVIIALSSRPYVKAAVNAGYDVIAIDTFIDQDTQAMAKRCIQVTAAHSQFDADMLLAELDQLDPASVDGVCYGAGFEAQPELMEEIAQRFDVYGNRASSIRLSKDPQNFYAFCQRHAFATPEISLQKPDVSKDWLVKQIGGSGGTHIHKADTFPLSLKSDQYYQQYRTGTPVSCLFLACDKQATAIGFNEQWVTPDQHLPFKYGGAVSQIALTADLKRTFERFITLAASEFQLTGLNSADALVTENSLVMLEINPRLSATLDLYAPHTGVLFKSHVRAFGSSTLPSLNLTGQPKAHHVIYARQPLHIEPGKSWPEWVSDIPQQSQYFEAGMPICTVTAEGDNAAEAKRNALARAGMI